MNQLFLVGRINEIIKTSENKTIINIAVKRTYKDMNEEYLTDLINISLYHYIASSVLEYCKTGDLVGVKGRIECNNEKELEIIADKITFLSQANKESVYDYEQNKSE